MQKQFFKEFNWVIILFISPFILIVIGDNFYSFGNFYTMNLGLYNFFKLWISIFGFLGIAFNIYIHQQRLQKQEFQLEKQQEQIELQKKSERDAQFAKGIELLGNSNSSISYGGAIILIDLVKNYKDEYREIVFDVLCSHIRNITSKEEYQKKYKKKPSNEIQRIAYFLFTKKLTDNYLFQGLKGDLSYSYLNGIDLNGAKLIQCNLNYSYLKGAMLVYANLEFSFFIETHFDNAWMQDSNLRASNAPNAFFIGTKLQDAKMECIIANGAKFTNAILFNTHLDCALLQFAEFNGEQLSYSSFLGSFLDSSEFIETIKINTCHFGGADLRNMKIKLSNINNANDLLIEGIVEKELIELLSDLEQKKDNKTYEGINRLKSLINEFNKNNKVVAKNIKSIQINKS